MDDGGDKLFAKNQYNKDELEIGCCFKHRITCET